MTVSSEQMVENILTVIARASASERDEGLNWYTRAHDIAAVLADSRGARGRGRSRKVRTWSAVLAVLSPQTSWETNIALAAAAARDGRCDGGTFSRNCDKANALIVSDSADPLTVTYTASRQGQPIKAKAVSGDKVTAFYQCIWRPENTHHVVIDRHAVHLALGRVLTDAERNTYLRPTRSRNNYELVSDAYRTAAARLGILPNQAQAIAWVVWRNELLGAAKEV